LQVELTQALERIRKGVVVDKANIAIMGKFLPVDDPEDGAGDSRMISEKILLEPTDLKTGDVIKPITVYIRRIRDIAALEGSTLAIDPEDDERDQNRDLRDHLENPAAHQAHLREDRISSHAGSPYSLSIAAKPRDMPSSPAMKLTPTLDKDGRAHVSIDVGQCYELTLHNGSDQEIAIGVRVDGIDVFTFSEDCDPQTGRPTSSRFVVDPHGSTTVYGWYKTGDASRSDNFQQFLITEYGHGAASQMPSESLGKIGVITVAISNSHKPGDGRARGGAETGFGPPVKVNVQRVERVIDPPHDFISVRYLR
jgi:hypothetical protein